MLELVYCVVRLRWQRDVTHDVIPSHFVMSQYLSKQQQIPLTAWDALVICTESLFVRPNQNRITINFTVAIVSFDLKTIVGL